LAGGEAAGSGSENEGVTQVCFHDGSGLGLLDLVVCVLVIGESSRESEKLGATGWWLQKQMDNKETRRVCEGNWWRQNEFLFSIGFTKRK
jgi:hypothetical protein